MFLEVEIEGEPEALEHDELRWATPAETSDLHLAPADAAFAASVQISAPPFQ